MRKTPTILVLFFFALNMNLAQTSLSTAMDFTVTDRFGEEHNLYDILDSGKFVLIDFFAHHCEPCCGITPDINELYQNFGCNESQIHIISIEGAGSINELESFENICGGTSEKPVVTGVEGNGTEIAVQYELGFYPTVLIIAPNREIVETDIWPFSYHVAKSKLQEHGVIPSICPLPAATQNVTLRADVSVMPNPASSTARLEFTLTESSNCNIKLLDITGQTKRVLFNEYTKSGMSTIDFDVSDVAVGTYIIKLETDQSGPQIVKLVIAR